MAFVIYGDVVAGVLLVHSPLVGPSSMARLAHAAGHTALLPDLTGIADRSPPRWPWYIEAAIEAAGDRDVRAVVGHSGAGVALPQIGLRLGAPLVFVDAVLPPASGAHRASSGLLELVAANTGHDGRLKPWLDWWPAETVERLVPEPPDRAELRADMPRLPADFYAEPVAVPDGWTTHPSGYLRLSAAYDHELNEASERGWPSRSLDGTHLDPFTRSARVLEAIEELRAELDGHT